MVARCLWDGVRVRLLVSVGEALKEKWAAQVV